MYVKSKCENISYFCCKWLYKILNIPLWYDNAVEFIETILLHFEKFKSNTRSTMLWNVWQEWDEVIEKIPMLKWTSVEKYCLVS